MIICVSKNIMPQILKLFLEIFKTRLSTTKRKLSNYRYMYGNSPYFGKGVIGDSI